MPNIANNPWLEKKQTLLANSSSAFPAPFLKKILSNQHKYVARRGREGQLIEGLDYERMAKHVWDGTIVKHLIPTQPIKKIKDSIYFLQYKYETVESGELFESGGRRMSLEINSDKITAKNVKVNACCFAPESTKKVTESDIINEFQFAVGSELIRELDKRYIQKLFDISTKHPSLDLTEGGNTFKDIFHNIIKVSSDIARQTRRGCGNWILVSPMMVSILQTVYPSSFTPATDYDFKGPNYTMLVGTLHGSIKVYTYLPDMNTPEKILVGYKGGVNELDGGMIYSPHTLITHGRRFKKDGVMYLPFATKEATYVVPNASAYYASFEVKSFNFA
jgi:hypothetical protein